MSDKVERRSQLLSLIDELNSVLLVNSVAELMSYLQDHNISAPRFMVLQLLESSPGITITAIAQELKLTLGSASQLIDRLEHDGLVSRQEVKSDRRVRRIFLREKGQEIIAQCRSMASIKQLDLLSNVPPNHLNTLYTALSLVLPYVSRKLSDS
jgi:DNA-binding MarR family transcriptional regulator